MWGGDVANYQATEDFQLQPGWSNQRYRDQGPVPPDEFEGEFKAMIPSKDGILVALLRRSPRGDEAKVGLSNKGGGQIESDRSVLAIVQAG